MGNSRYFPVDFSKTSPANIRKDFPTTDDFQMHPKTSKNFQKTFQNVKKCLKTSKFGSNKNIEKNPKRWTRSKVRNVQKILIFSYSHRAARPLTPPPLSQPRPPPRQPPQPGNRGRRHGRSRAIFRRQLPQPADRTVFGVDKGVPSPWIR